MAAEVRGCARGLVLGLWLLGRLAPAAAQGSGIELSLSVGEQRVISSEGVVSFSEGVEGIVDVRLTPDATQFVIVGRTEGQTTLLLLMETGEKRLYRIEVVSTEPQAQESDGAVRERDNIRLDFFFVQLDTQHDRNMGVRWPNELGTAQLAGGYDFIAGATSPATAVVNTQLMPRLEMAEGRGWAKVLRRASVITASGTSANFSSGGEVNIPVINAFAAGFEAVQYGSTVKVSPRYDDTSGRIELSIQAEVSELKLSPGVDVPGRTTAALNTLVNLELGQSLVVAGLSAESEKRARSGVPGLSQIPILGGLFGKHSRQGDRSENVIYIIPSLVEATSADTRQELEHALGAYSEFAGKRVPSLAPVGPLP